MEHSNDAMALLDMIPRPTFCVRGGLIVKVNQAAERLFLQTGTEIQKLLLTGAEEYASFSDGRLYLTLNVSGQTLGFSVNRISGADYFRMEQDGDNAELHAMALAARELRDPLASVMVTAERLFPVSGLSDDPGTRELVARINRGLFQMLRVISNMSDANRYSTDTPARQEVHNICAFLDEVFSRASELVQHSGITLEYTGHPEAVYTLLDSEKLERAVYNIISNAMKFTPKGSIIRAALTRRKNKLYLSIQDNGTGIPEPVRADIYSRYCREPGIEDGRFGIGLGMVLIRAAATLHGGTVLIDHPENAGTRITMSLQIRPGTGTQLRSPAFRVDYAGERDHGLLELSDALPSELYK